jgi:hypothetical protein
MRHSVTSWFAGFTKSCSRQLLNGVSSRNLRRPRRAYSRRLSAEPLEDRNLLAVIWANEFGSGANNPNFGIYGANEVYARALVNRAIIDWNNVIRDQNWDNDNNPATNGVFELFVFASELNGLRGATDINAVTANVAGITPEVPVRATAVVQMMSPVRAMAGISTQPHLTTWSLRRLQTQERMQLVLHSTQVSSTCLYQVATTAISIGQSSMRLDTRSGYT